MPHPNQSEQTRAACLLGCVLVMAHQVAGKALRDGLYLSCFPSSALPKVVALAALVAVLLGLAFARGLSCLGTLRVVPAAFGAGAILHVAEFALLRILHGGARGMVVVLVYVHLAGIGSILLSGFWSVAGEVFDPRTARREFGRIAGAGTIGGIGGGLLMERSAVWLGMESPLLILAALHLVTCIALWRLRASGQAQAPSSDAANPWHAARQAFRQAPFLVNLGVLVFLATMSATLLDYLFKSGAAAAYGRGPQLTRYFALFYTGGQVLTFLSQTFLTPLALRRLGLGRTVQWHSTAVAVGAGASLLLPALIMAPAARLLELVFRFSFFRSSYELFFTPVPPADKRAVKTFIDVTFDRVGDVAGAAILQLLLLLGPHRGVETILMVTVALGGISFWITRRMDAAYSRVLEHGLLTRAVALSQSAVEDSTTLTALLQTTATFSKRPAAAAPPPAPARVGVQDPLLARLAGLRSGDPQRVRSALAAMQPFETAVVPFAIRLLAWSESFEWARAFLMRYAHRCVGQLVDALLDPEQDFAVRRRIPHILAYSSSQRATDGLTSALSDPRFELRFNASRALEFLHRMSEGLRFDRAALMAAVERELSSSRSIWHDRKLLDRRDALSDQAAYLDDVLRDQADKSLEHVFSLLACLLPAEPLKIAFRGLHSQDRLLRGLALEFLESHLSVALVSQLRRLAEPEPALAGEPV